MLLQAILREGVCDSVGSPRSLSLRGVLRRGNPLRVLSTALLLAFISAAFSPATTGCSGAPGVADPSILATRKATAYYIDDHLGSAQLMTDGEGNVVYEGVTAPYGLDLDGLASTEVGDDGESAAGVDYSYTTKERDDETGLVYFGKRYYSPDMGRWITPDPLFLENPENIQKTPHEGNLYSYVRNNPSTYIDIEGEFACGGICITAVAVGAAALKTAAIVKGVQYLTEYAADRPLGSTEGVNEALAIGIGVPVAAIGVAGGAMLAPVAVTAIGEATLALSYAAYSAQTAVLSFAGAEAGYALSFGKSLGYSALRLSLTHPNETQSFIEGAILGFMGESTGLPSYTPEEFVFAEFGTWAGEGLQGCSMDMPLTKQRMSDEK